MDVFLKNPLISADEGAPALPDSLRIPFGPGVGRKKGFYLGEELSID